MAGPRGTLAEGRRVLRGISAERAAAFSTVLPAWLGLDTLELLQRADRRHPSSGKVKIARGDVYLRMWKAFLFSWKEAL